MTSQLPDQAAIGAIKRFGRAALAWEVLRRDPEYCMAFEHSDTPPADGQAVDPAFTARWGLHFR